MQSPSLISLRKCATRLTESGDPIKNPALGRYVKKHGLSRGTGPRRAVLVDFAEVSQHRKDNFTREWAAQGNKKSNPAPNPAVKPKLKEVKLDKTSAQSAPAKEPIKIDRVREAKAMREESLAYQEKLNLEQRLGNIIYLDQAESGLVMAVDVVRDKTQGPGASDFADFLISEFKLPSALKREILRAVKNYGTELQTAFSESCASLISSLTNDDLNDVIERHEAMANLAFTMRAKTNTAAESAAQA